MDDAIHKAIADLSALIKDADSKDAERIREIVERLKNFQRIATHYEKRAANYLAMIHIAAILLWI